MKRSELLSVLVIPFAMLCATASSAQQLTKLKQGLWQMRVTGDLSELIASQRAQFEAFIADPTLDAQTRKLIEGEMETIEDQLREPTLQCLTPSQVSDIASMLHDQTDDDCDNTVAWVEPDLIESVESCARHDSDEKLVTHSSIQIMSAELMTGTASMSGADGVVQYQLEFQWLADDCGDVEPD